MIANAEALSASGQLTPSRVPATLMTLRRNTEFWRWRRGRGAPVVR